MVQTRILYPHFMQQNSGNSGRITVAIILALSQGSSYERLKPCLEQILGSLLTRQFDLYSCICCSPRSRECYRAKQQDVSQHCDLSAATEWNWLESCYQKFTRGNQLSCLLKTGIRSFQGCCSMFSLKFLLLSVAKTQIASGQNSDCPRFCRTISRARQSINYPSLKDFEIQAGRMSLTTWHWQLDIIGTWFAKKKIAICPEVMLPSDTRWEALIES